MVLITERDRKQYNCKHDWTEISRSIHPVTRKSVSLIRCFKCETQSIKLENIVNGNYYRY